MISHHSLIYLLTVLLATYTPKYKHLDLDIAIQNDISQLYHTDGPIEACCKQPGSPRLFQPCWGLCEYLSPTTNF